MRRFASRRTTITLALASGLATYSAPNVAGAQGGKPNIPFIMSDDIGYMQPGFPPLQAPASCNLSQVLEQVKGGGGNASD